MRQIANLEKVGEIPYRDLHYYSIGDNFLRIITGHDYYDSALAFGSDESIVFVREKSKKIDESTDNVKLPVNSSTPSLHLTSKNNRLFNICYDFWTDVDNTQHIFRECRVYVAGSYWNGLRLDTYYQYKLKSQEYFWDWKPVSEWLNARQLTPYGRSNNSSRYYSIVCKEWFGENPCSKNELDWLITNNITVLTYSKNETVNKHWKVYGTWQFNGDNLKELKFFKVLDAYSTFQRISQWIGGVIAPSGNPMIEITNDSIKVHKHGFDKWSFRKLPET